MSGTAPDSSPLPGDLPSRPPCPFCGGRETEIHSLFGSHASVTTYWCRACRSPFEQMKWGRRHTPRKPPPDSGGGSGSEADDGP